jgi:alkaline phosphatase
MTALKKFELAEVSEASVFDGAHTGLISSTCINDHLPASFALKEGAGHIKVIEKKDIFGGSATGLVSSTS